MKRKITKDLAFLALVFSTSAAYAIPIVGSSTGIFENPVGPAGMVTTGVGTDTFTWGVGSPPSSLSFSGASFSVESDDVFSFGTLDYFNGTISAGTGADAVDLSVLISLTSPTGINEGFSYNIALENTPNTSNPYASADIVFLPPTIPNSFFSVDGVDYTLEFLGFGDITGSGFTSVDRFHVLEGYSASTQLLGRVTSTSVPEPSTLLLLATGLAGFGFSRARKMRS